jgi:scyllo-inositol 2-dehydrogenase (NADP+)
LPINVAVVGLGKMGVSHLAILNALEDFRVAAICDSSSLVGGVLGKVANVPAFTSYDELIAHDGLDAIVIATPTALHESMVRKALEKGLHIFCEKPLTLRAAESADLAELAADRCLVTQVGYHNRFVGTFQEAARLISDGALGRVTHVLGEAYGPVVLRRAKPTWRGKSDEGGGCLYDYAAHPLNLLTWFFGRPQSCLGAQLRRGFSAEVDDEVYALLDFREGLTGQLSVNWSDASTRKMTTRISVWGEGGKLSADRQEIQTFLTGSGTVPPSYHEGWNVRYITELTPPVSFYLRGEEYSAQVEAFGRAIMEGKGRSENDFASAAETDAVIEMIGSAAAAGADGTAAPTAPALGARSSLFGKLLSR